MAKAREYLSAIIMLGVTIIYQLLNGYTIYSHHRLNVADSVVWDRWMDIVGIAFVLILTIYELYLIFRFLVRKHQFMKFLIHHLILFAGVYLISEGSYFFVDSYYNYLGKPLFAWYCVNFSMWKYYIIITIIRIIYRMWKDDGNKVIFEKFMKYKLSIISILLFMLVYYLIVLLGSLLPAIIVQWIRIVLTFVMIYFTEKDLSESV